MERVNEILILMLKNFNRFW